ncbi:MAG TPA: putative lipopolysaccharide heptosyltransferase III [Nitrospiraceae bacterium]|nr:putative lipopolysaccharide heptosyltransferase III [Nitrospiraceae bacterium]
MDLRNILIIKLRYIGDVLLATPVLRALRDAFPQACLTMAVNRGTEAVLISNPDLNEVLVVDRQGLVGDVQFLRDVRQRRFDCVIDLTDADRSAMIARASGAPVRIGFNDEHRWRGLLYTCVVRGTKGHRIERDLDAVRALGLEPKRDHPVLTVSDHEEREAAVILKEVGTGSAVQHGRPLVLLHPGARYWFKAWPAERFAELAHRLSQAYDCELLIAGGAQDGDMIEAIRAYARTPIHVVAGRAGLRQFAAILKRCALFIGNDNGAMHMAAAMGTPIVALFGPSDPAEWGPRGPRVTVLYKGLDCRTCFHPTCRRGEDNCMRQISVDEVFAAAAKILTPLEIVGGRG